MPGYETLVQAGTATLALHVAAVIVGATLLSGIVALGAVLMVKRMDRRARAYRNASMVRRPRGKDIQD